MDTTSFCSLVPELTLSSGEDTVNEELSQHPLSDSILPHELLLENMDAENGASNIQYSEVSEGPLTPRSIGDVSVDISDDDCKKIKTAQNFNSPSTSSSAYFSLVEDACQSNSNANRFTESRKVEIVDGKQRRRFLNNLPQQRFLSSSESSTITLKKDSDINNLQDVNLEPTCEYEGKIEDKSQSGATDEDVVDWPSDHEEDLYTRPSSNGKEKRGLNYVNFKDKPRGEPMGSENILPSTAFPLNNAYNSTYSVYRTNNYELDGSNSESEKLSGESSDELDIDVKRSYWLRRNIEGSDDNANLPLPQISLVDDSVRPPLVGQSEENNDFASLQTISSDLRGGESELEMGATDDILIEVEGLQHLDAEIRALDANENDYDLEINRSESILGNHQRVTSPSVMSVSSVASSKRLEWDSGADIGYGGPKVTYGLSTLEKMAIGCSALKKRMEPEGKSSFVKDVPTQQTISLPSPIQSNSAALQKGENCIAVKDDTKDIELKDVFKNILVLRNNAVRSASLSDLSAKKNHEHSTRPHSCSITDINTVSPFAEPSKIISSSSCSAVSTSSSNTVIGMPCSQDSTITSSNKLFKSDAIGPIGDFSDFDSSNLKRSSEPFLATNSSARSKSAIELDNTRLKIAEPFDEKTVALYTKNFVDQICVGSDEKRKTWLVKKILEDFGIVPDSSSVVEPSSTISTPTSSVSLSLPPPPPAFEDPVVSEMVTAPFWDHSIDSETSQVSSVLEPILGMRNEIVGLNVRNSDSSLNTVKEVQQQLASSFEYYDAGKSERSDHSERDDIAWVNVLKKKKIRDGRNNTSNQLDDSCSSDAYNSNRNLLMKFSSLNKPSSLYSSESTTSDYQIGNANSIHTMKRFIRRLEVVDSWHPEGVELVKDLIQKQRRSYMRRLQREVDWLERLEKILAVNSDKSFRLEKESQTNYFTKKSTFENYKRSCIKITKDFGQSYPTPISTDSEQVEEKLVPKIRTSTIGIQTSKSEFFNDSVNSNSAIFSSFQRTKFAEKERPVVSIPLTKVIGIPTSKFSTVPNKAKEQSEIRNGNRNSVAWFLPFGNGQPKMLVTGRRGIADGERSESPYSKSKRALRRCYVSKDNSLSLQDAFKCLKPLTIKRSEHRQQKIKMDTQLRKRTGSGSSLFNLKSQSLFHKVTVPLPFSAQHHKPQRRILSHFEMREQTEKIYKVLPEIVEKNELKLRENHYRTNRLMAFMFRKKLQGKVLKGQVSHLNTQKCV